MQLHVAASVQRVGIGPRRPVRHQSIFRERGKRNNQLVVPLVVRPGIRRGGEAEGRD